MNGGAKDPGLPDPVDVLPSYRYQEPWTATFMDNMRLFSVQLVCAGGSGAIAKTAVAPLERVKILLQVQPMSTLPAEARYKGLVDALRRIPAREGGWRALYRGNGANVARLIPEVGFKFAVHEQLRLLFSPPDGSPLGVREKAAAGAATGVLKTLLFYPLDLARTRITADTAAKGAARAAPGVLSCLRLALAREGLRSPWKGLGLSLPGVILYNSASFTVYDELKARLPEDRASRDALWYPLAKVGCGAAAGAIAQTLSYPLDTLRRRMQMSGAPGTRPDAAYRGYLDAAATILRREGPAALLRGAGVNMLKTVPGAAVQFVAYDLLRVGVTTLDPTTGATSPL